MQTHPPKLDLRMERTGKKEAGSSGGKSLSDDTGVVRMKRFVPSL